MAKPSTKKRDADISDDSGILEHFGIEPVEEKNETKKAEPSTEVDALVARLDRLEQDNRTLQQSNLALMSAPKPVYDPGPPPIVEPVQADLPDPVSDPAAYNAEINRRMDARIDSVVASVTQQFETKQQGTSRVDALWDEFAESHSEYAENQDRVEFAATKVVQRAQKKGVNLDTYMFTTSDQFFSDVTKEMDKTFPKADPKPAEGDPKPPEDGEELRTGGIFGGAESGSKPAASEKDTGGDLLTDLQDLQKASGFF